MKKNRKTIGELVKSARMAASLTQVDLAAAVEITQPFLAQIELGLREPSIDTLRKIAATLGVPLKELVGD